LFGLRLLRKRGGQAFGIAGDDLGVIIAVDDEETDWRDLV
jgi:hypothetical protein